MFNSFTLGKTTVRQHTKLEFEWLTACMLYNILQRNIHIPLSYHMIQLLLCFVFRLLHKSKCYSHYHSSPKTEHV